MCNKIDLGLYLVTDQGLLKEQSLLDALQKALSAGVRVIQLREKETSTRAFCELAFQVKELCQHYSVPLLINDRVDIALAIDADGVHLGQSDMPYYYARKLLGPDKIIGLTVQTWEDIKIAECLDVDYVGLSCIYPTQTKTDWVKAWGIEGLIEVRKECTHPIVGIGGIHQGNLGEVLANGADGAAMVSAILAADDITKTVQEMRFIVDQVKRGTL